MKRLQAIIAAALITAVVAASMLVIGASAWLNPNRAPLQDSPAAAAPAAITSGATGNGQDQVAQLQNLVAQYQSREKQYQSQISQLNGQLGQYQQILQQLQQMGVIRVGNDGSIQVRRGGFGRDGD